MGTHIHSGVTDPALEQFCVVNLFGKKKRVVKRKADVSPAYRQSWLDCLVGLREGLREQLPDGGELMKGLG
jgi:hypothetical protein